MVFIKKTSEDRVFDIINYTFLTIILIAVSFPLMNVISSSVSNPEMVASGKVLLLPKGITFEGYRRIFKDPDIWTGYKNSILYTVVGVIVNLFMTVTAAYPLSRKEFRARKYIMMMYTFTMFFGGGLIPSFLLIQSLGLYDNFWVMIIPGAVSMHNIILARTFFQSSIPEELREAAVMDGCNHFRYMLKVLLPLSKAILAVMVLFYGIAHWNDFFTALIYISDRKKIPLQLVLREILIQSQFKEAMIESDEFAIPLNRERISEIIKFGLIIVGSLPLIILYPFIQKHFVKGVMIGSIKG